jgi:hypothetical protein
MVLTGFGTEPASGNSAPARTVHPIQKATYTGAMRGASTAQDSATVAGAGRPSRAGRSALAGGEAAGNIA